MRITFMILMCMGLSAYAEEAVLAPWVGNTLSGASCMGSQGYGPFDYTKRHMYPRDLELVEGAHFKPDVENLAEGKHRSSIGTVWPDLDYTLRSWPNHARALLSIIRFQLKKNQKLTRYDIPIPPECYLYRAINFNPRDPVPYTLFGYYLHKVGQLDKADQFYKKAMELDPDNAKFAYSYSLLMIDMKNYEEALRLAEIAYKHPKTPRALKRKLKKLGVWDK